jgi:hypothetical protein
MEQLAVHSVAALAARSKSLEALEAELFEFRKVVDDFLKELEASEKAGK